MDEAIRSTEDEDELRTKKENELRKINEKLEKERQKDNEIKNQQIELAKLQKEQKAKNFTYDYDGKVILVHGVKTEKFPPATYTCKFNLFFNILSIILYFYFYIVEIFRFLRRNFKRFRV